MSTIAEELTRIQNAKASLATSIAAKGVEVPAVTKIDGYAALVDQISQGGPTEPPMKALCFYDYDGTRLYSYDEDEVAAMTELPALPDHTDMGLVQEGWNWTLADIKTQIQLVGACDVGCTYATNDGRDHIHIKIDDENYMSPSLYINVYNGYPIKVDWGDGSEDETVSTSNPSHTYTNLGEYTIKIEGNKVKRNNVQSSYIWDGYATSSIASAIYRRYVRWLHVCNPNISHGHYSFENLTLDWLILSGQAGCSINALSPLRFTSVPALIVNPSFGGIFYLSTVNVLVTKVVCMYNLDIKSAHNTYTSGDMVYRIACPYKTRSQITSRNIPFYIYNVDSTTCFESNTNVVKYKIHCEGSSTIVSYGFRNNYKLEEVEFHEYDTVPTLSNVSAFSGCPTGFKIIVPQSLYAEWKAATNWSTFADYIYYRDSNGDLKQ